MKLLFSCDDYCYCANGKYYFREFGDILIKRYLVVFEKIRVSVRTKYVSEQELGIYNIPVDDDRVEIYPLPFFQGPKQYLNVYFETQKRLRQVIDNCDACIVRLPSSIAYAVLDRVKRKKMPYGVEVVANPKELSRGGNVIHQFFWKILYKNLLKACAEADSISYVTQYSLQRIYPANKFGHYETFYSSVDLSDNMFEGPRKASHTPFVLCHVSNPITEKGKGHDVLIQLTYELIKKGYDIRVKIAGDGPAIGYFKELANSLGIGERVKFVGFLKKEELKNFLLSSDLMIFPTLSEGLPRVIIEAMATGLPCLSTPVGGIPELLRSDCLFNPNDVEGFVSKTEYLINNNEVYREHSKMNYEKSLEYSSVVLSKRRIAMYNSLKTKI